MNRKPWLVAGIVLCLLYILSPIDLIPEFPLGPLGLVDDAAVLGFMIYLVRQLWSLREIECTKEPEGVVIDAEIVAEEEETDEPPKLADGK